MKRREFIKVTGDGLPRVRRTMAAPAIAQSMPEIKWAHDDELAEIARHPARRRRADGENGRRGDRQ